MQVRNDLNDKKLSERILLMAETEMKNRHKKY